MHSLLLYCSVDFTIINFLILTLNYGLIYNLNIEENNPNNISTLYSFSFVNHSSYNPEYYESIPNLGYTGRPIYDCYRGECHYYREYQCEKWVCKNDDGDNECEWVTTTCKSSLSEIQYKSSTQCKDTNAKFCNSCDNRKDYSNEKCSCSHVDSDYYSPSFYCNADNLILKWKNYYYKNNSGNFNYLDNAVPSNQNCPSRTRIR